MTPIKTAVRKCIKHGLKMLGRDANRTQSNIPSNLLSDGAHVCNFCATVFQSSPDQWHPECLACPECDAIGRERFVYHCLSCELPPTEPKIPYPFVRAHPALQTSRLLEFSPRHNPRRRSIYEETCLSYQASDFDCRGHKADFKLDLTDDQGVGFYTGRFDVVICAHVLEHIPDYRAALVNLRRLLSKNGFLILQIPLQEKSYTQVTWDEFHGDKTRVFHRFAFDIVADLADIFDSVKVMIAEKIDVVSHPEINPQKYDYLHSHPDIHPVEAGEQLCRLYGLGPMEYCDAFILRGSI